MKFNHKINNMGGEGFSFAAISSLKNNRRQLKDKNPFSKRAKEMHIHHIESHETKQLSESEMRKLKMKLLKERIKDRRTIVFTFIAITIALIVVVLLISGLTSF